MKWMNVDEWMNHYWYLAYIIVVGCGTARSGSLCCVGYLFLCGKDWRGCGKNKGNIFNPNAKGNWYDMVPLPQYFFSVRTLPSQYFGYLISVAERCVVQIKSLLHTKHNQKVHTKSREYYPNHLLGAGKNNVAVSGVQFGTIVVRTNDQDEDDSLTLPSFWQKEQMAFASPMLPPEG